MRVLIFAPQLPYPPRQGTAIRNWGLLKRLAVQHAITLATLAHPGEVVHPDLQAACARVVTVPPPARTRADRLRGLLRPTPDLAQRLATPAVVEAARAAGPFDAIIYEGLEMTFALDQITAPVTVYDAHNAEYVIQRRAFWSDVRQPRRWLAAAYSLTQWPRIARYEAAVSARVTHVACVSAEDAAALRALNPRLQPLVIPNGIDLHDYDLAQVTAMRWDAPTCVFTGKMDYRPNVDAVLWYAQAIHPRVRAVVPQAQLVVVGQQPTPAVQALHGQAGITITGAVADARPYIAGADVYVAPLRMGGGTRFKLLEAMMLERPIVSTPIGAEGFAVRDGVEMRLAESPAAFAQAVVQVLADRALARALGQGGARFARAHYDWDRIVPRLAEALTG